MERENRAACSALAAHEAAIVRYTTYVEREDTRGAFWLSTVAALSVAMVLSVVAWKLSYTKPVAMHMSPMHTTIVPEAALSRATDTDNDGAADWEEMLVGTDPNNASSSPKRTSSVTKNASTTDTSPLVYATEALAGSIITGYLNLAQNGEYTAARGEALGQTLAQNLYAPVSYTKHDVSKLSTDTDNSSARSAQYRTDMNTALAPLTKNTEAPFSLLANYYVRGDENAFEELRVSAKRYRDAEENVARVVVPHNAASTHVRLLDALSYSANTIDAMARYARDPAAAAQLLKTYNDVEQALVGAFDALDAYYLQTISYAP